MRFSRPTTTLKVYVSVLLIFPQLYSLDKGLEAQLANAFVLVIIPQYDLVHWELGMLSITYQCKDVASEEHFNYSNSSIELYSLNTSILPLLNVSLNGYVL
jgi:hypothetical protein